jgi:OOP family OmpA-OmpF porin|tara:strand:- start:70 stop:681 length:612 start_codon:yes stop_codon:yes gene_type:complete
MKNFSKLLLMLLVTISYTNIQSQDNNNPWQFTFGVHAVDLNADTETQFGDYFNVDEEWNVSPGLSMFTLSKYLGDNLSLGFNGAMNSISNFADDHQFVNEVTYFSFDGMLKYSLSEVLNTEKVEPYVGVGLGNTWMDSQSWMTTNASLGMNYWFSDVWGLTAQVDYKQNMGDSGRGNTVMLDEGGSMRYSVGFSVKFGGSDKE